MTDLTWPRSPRSMLIEHCTERSFGSPPLTATTSPPRLKRSTSTSVFCAKQWARKPVCVTRLCSSSGQTQCCAQRNASRTFCATIETPTACRATGPASQAMVRSPDRTADSDPGPTGAASTGPVSTGAAPHGVAVIDKPAAWTSHDVVAKCRGVLGTRKVGHSGTLDPAATGVLVLGVGKATRLLRFLAELPKTYLGEIVLGVETSTLDADGEISATHDMSAVTEDQVRAAALSFVGPIMQVPPMVSAVTPPSASRRQPAGCSCAAAASNAASPSAGP